jgi:hypothetical protein
MGTEGVKSHFQDIFYSVWYTECIYDSRVPLEIACLWEQPSCLTRPFPLFLFFFLYYLAPLLPYQRIQNKLQRLSTCVKQISTLETSDVPILYLFQAWKELGPIKSELLREMNILYARFLLNVTAIA